MVMSRARRGKEEKNEVDKETIGSPQVLIYPVKSQFMPVELLIATLSFSKVFWFERYIIQSPKENVSFL